MSAANKHLRYRGDIDGLRAIAVLAVVGFHAFPDWVRGGFVGVDIFFVISGFLISTILLQALEADTFSFTEFYTRRIRRLFPALSVTLLAVVACGWVSLQPAEYEQLGKHVLAGAGFVSNFALWGESGYFDGNADAKPLLHLWSLGIEEQFYLVWPFALWLSTKFGVNWLFPMAGIGIASFVANVATIDTSPRDAFFFPQTRFWELMIGSALAYAAVRARGTIRLSSTMADASSLVGLGCIAASLALINEASAFPGWWALLPAIGAALAILAGNQAWLNRVVLSSPPLVGVGLISYPLYLWHWSLLAYARILVNPEGSADIDPSRAIRVALVLTSFGLAWLTYRVIERPIRTGARGGTKALGLVALMTMIGVFGWSAYVNGGYPGRVATSRERSSTPGRMIEDNYQSHPASPALFRDVVPVAGRDMFLGRPFSAAHFDIAVVGDSHAWVLYDGLRRSTARSISIAGRGTCPPLLNTDAFRRDNGVETPLVCQPLVNNVLEYFSRDAETSVIVITAFFGQYGRDVRLARPGSPSAATPDALRETLQLLGRSGKTVILAYDVPEIPRACYRRQFPVWSTQPRGECTVARDVYEAGRRDLVEVVREVSSALPNVSAYDPAAVLCSETRCGEIDERRTLYLTDGNHVNTDAAQRLGADLARFIERQLAVPNDRPPVTLALMQGTGDQFGYEWGKYTAILPEFEDRFRNWVEPLAPDDFRGAAVLDAGCGIGRNSFWVLKYGASRVVACDVDDRTLASARANLTDQRAEVVRCSIDALPWTDTFDVAMSIGVVHHVVDPRRAVANLVKATKPGGRTLIWVYGREGNERLLLFLEPLRAVTKRLPPRLTHALTYLFSLPMFVALKLVPTTHPYFVRAKTWRFSHLHLIMFDQLLPRIAHYWTKAEALDLFRDLPVTRLEAFRKNHNSWTVIAVRADHT